MPRRPDTPCRHPGCARLVPYGSKYCEEHAPKHRDESRTTSEKGYGWKWQQESRAFLRANPLCTLCAERGRYVKATVVDHITPHRGDPRLFWDRNNWQSLCKSCHDHKTMTEDKDYVYRY